MAQRNVIKSITLSAIVASTAYLCITQLINLNFKTKKTSIQTSAFTNLVKNINSYQDVAEIRNEPESDIRKEEMIISSISKEISREIYKSKNIRVTKARTKIKSKSFVEDKVIIVQSSVKKSVSYEALDLSMFEINNTELISLGRFEKSRPAVAKISFNGFKYDEVSNAVASVAKTEIIKEESNTVETIAGDSEEMPVFDYSEKTGPSVEKKEDKRLYERKISKSVLSVIQREMDNAPKIKTKPHTEEPQVSKEILDIMTKNFDETKEEAQDNTQEDQVVYDYSSTNRTPEIKASNKSAFIPTPVQSVGVNIQAINVNMVTHKKTKATSYEFLPDYDRNERVYDNNTGEVRIGYSANDSIAIQTGVIEQRGMVPTRVEIVMDTHNQIIPLFEETSFSAFLDQRGIATNSSVLISIPTNVLDVEIDSEYGEKLNLDKSFKISETSRQFILFLGVKTGNIMIRYRLENSTAEKIVFVGDGEMFFEEPVISESSRETFELTTRSLLGVKSRELNIDAGDVTVFNSNIKSKKSALNVYQLRMPSMLSGARKYLEIKYDGNSVFVGAKKGTNIEIPSKDFVQKVIEYSEIPNLDNRCLVQLSLSKEVSDIKIGGKNKSGEMFIETSFLDTDGRFNKESIEGSEKVFVLGEQEGIISLLLNYADGSSESLKTYCSDGTYLIEQL